MTRPVRLALVLAAAIAATAPLGAEQGEPPQAVLFVVSAPMGAGVVLDGEPLEARTPLLLRSLAPGRHTVLVSAEGYPPQEQQVDLGAGEVAQVRVDLSAAFVRLGLPEESTVRVGKSDPGAGQKLLQLPLGRYRLRRDEGELRLQPEHPAEGWIRGLSLALPLSLAFAGVLTAHDVYYPKRLALDLGPSVSLSPATISAYGISVAIGAVDLGLLARRARFRRTFSYTSVPVERSLATAAALYQQAEDYLSRGQLQEALRAYASVMSGFPDSLLFPEALFKSARIHFLTGEDDLAIAEFGLLAERYPLPDLYDRARRGLADLMLRRRAFEQCLQQLAAMVFSDPAYAREETELFAAQTLEDWFAADVTVLPRVIEAYQALADRYPGSTGSAVYLYRLAYYLHLADRDAEAAAALQRVPAGQGDSALRERIEALRRALSAGG
jgi:tetratricopeptide (TPR) repeat protein